jgi:hypothetical protein
MNISGMKFGKLTAIHPLDSRSGRYLNWEFQCECGNIVTRSTKNLKRNNLNCGCGHAIKHGHARKSNITPEYISWRAMQARCLNSNHRSYKNYGGRGITISVSWLGENGFENFLADMGERPLGTSLDRIDPNGNYTKANCRWADSHTQRLNNRNTSFLKAA